MVYTPVIGGLDGLALIEANNVAVGFVPSNSTVLGVYPPIQIAEPISSPQPHDRPTSGTMLSGLADAGPHA
jgi:hypothetical protein